MLLVKRAFRTKSSEAIRQEEGHSELIKAFGLFDLLCIGVGATVGSGIFVLSGLIARNEAGPSLIFAWLIAGFVCCFSLLSFAELACRFPSSGSSYAFTYVTLGEWPAYLAACCLSLECGVSSSAVARSWGFKFDNFISGKAGEADEGVSYYGCGLEVVCVLILLCGANASKLTVNSLTIFKTVLIGFITVAGLSLFRPSNVQVMMPMGIGGVFRGTTSCFFGFVGADEVCCLALECKNPQRDIPIAVVGTVIISTVCYCFASLALVGMVNYTQIDTESCFPMAFRSRGWGWVGDIIAVSELIVLPLVVFVSFLAQPRILHSMALDRLVPQKMSVLDRHGNFRNGIISAGIVCVLIAAFVPFELLDDLISAGVLIQFTLTNISLIIVRRGWVAAKSAADTAEAVEVEAASLNAGIVGDHQENKEGTTEVDPEYRNIDVEMTSSLRSATTKHQHKQLSKLDYEVVDTASTHSPLCSDNSVFLDMVDTTSRKEVGNTTSTSIVNGELTGCSFRSSFMCEKLLALYCVVCIVFSLTSTQLLSSDDYASGGRSNSSSSSSSCYNVTMGVLMVLSFCSIVCLVWVIDTCCPDLLSKEHDKVDYEGFRVPCVPYVPLFGIFLNWYLLAQLSPQGMVLVCFFFFSCSLCYIAYGAFDFCVADGPTPTSAATFTSCTKISARSLNHPFESPTPVDSHSNSDVCETNCCNSCSCCSSSRSGSGSIDSDVNCI